MTSYKSGSTFSVGDSRVLKAATGQKPSHAIGSFRNMARIIQELPVNTHLISAVPKAGKDEMNMVMAGQRGTMLQLSKMK